MDSNHMEAEVCFLGALLNLRSYLINMMLISLCYLLYLYQVHLDRLVLLHICRFCCFGFHL